ncbi:MAG: hypothetical protein AMJ54_03295 [Deltaproteobacteria bacterium SG8_13]|nr:MAG: hypothetical protein AMJ54_03295 [Deltaproteobacteria bacterium SG8_13]
MFRRMHHDPLDDLMILCARLLPFFEMGTDAVGDKRRHQQLDNTAAIQYSYSFIIKYRTKEQRDAHIRIQMPAMQRVF